MPGVFLLFGLEGNRGNERGNGKSEFWKDKYCKSKQRENTEYINIWKCIQNCKQSEVEEYFSFPALDSW